MATKRSCATTPLTSAFVAKQSSTSAASNASSVADALARIQPVPMVKAIARAMHTQAADPAAADLSAGVATACL